MRTTDDAGNPDDMLTFSTPDFARLLSAVGEKAALREKGYDEQIHRLRTIRLDGGCRPLAIEVTVPGPPPEDPWTVSAYIARSRLPTKDHPTGCWQIHHPEQGPQMEFNTAQQVAKFLSAIPTFTEGWHEVWNRWMLARGELFASE
jgi:hypothetical protein